jgi:hypothetical protein
MFARRLPGYLILLAMVVAPAKGSPVKIVLRFVQTRCGCRTAMPAT